MELNSFLIIYEANWLLAVVSLGKGAIYFKSRAQHAKAPMDCRAALAMTRSVRHCEERQRRGNPPLFICVHSRRPASELSSFLSIYEPNRLLAGVSIAWVAIYFDSRASLALKEDELIGI
jgi:hypothetical protein